MSSTPNPHISLAPGPFDRRNTRSATYRDETRDTTHLRLFVLANDCAAHENSDIVLVLRRHHIIGGREESHIPDDEACLLHDLTDSALLKAFSEL